MVVIFDLDGTLANCDHRRHFVDPSYRNDCILYMSGTQKEQWVYREGWGREETRKKFVPDFKSFNEACDKDLPNKSVIDILEYIGEAKEYGSDTPWVDYDGIEIWSARCESQRKKTETWIYKHIRHMNEITLKLQMRPIGNFTPDEILKETWLDELLAQGKTVDFVFDDRKKVIDMWRQRGVFVFDCNQKGNVF